MKNDDVTGYTGHVIINPNKTKKRKLTNYLQIND